MGFADRVADLLPWLRRSARRYCSDRQDADDLAGDTVLKLLLYEERFDDVRDIRPLAAVVMRNTFLTWRTRMKEEHAWDLPDRCGTDDACWQAEMHDTLSVLKRCASSSVCVDSVVMYARGYSYDEIATRLGVPVGTVRSRISSGRSLIATTLKNVSKRKMEVKW